MIGRALLRPGPARGHHDRDLGFRRASARASSRGFLRVSGQNDGTPSPPAATSAWNCGTVPASVVAEVVGLVDIRDDEAIEALVHTGIWEGDPVVRLTFYA